MKNLTLAAIIILLSTSCASIKTYPIKGTYPDKPYEIVTQKSFDETWDKLIDIFAQNVLNIKLIGRSSGLIVSDKTKLTWT